MKELSIPLGCLVIVACRQPSSSESPSGRDAVALEQPAPATPAEATAGLHGQGTQAPSVRDAKTMPSAMTSEDQATLAPLRDVSWLEPLPLEGGELAYVTPALGAREPRPLMVGVHGAGDRPEWACGGWRLAASEYAFVVCPRGLPMGSQRFAWDAPRTIAERVRLAIQAVKQRYGTHVAEGPTLYVGFSQGATLAEAALLAEPGRFPNVALAEGGYNLLRDAGFLDRLHGQGTSRLLGICGSNACFATLRSAASHVSRAGIEFQVAGDPLSGHNLNQRMQDALQQAWPNFVRGLPNWAGFPAYLERRRRSQ
ncbi:MAG TPA: hypothetical protein VFQ61_03440 [Polyangiaceae bacterium]|nr:hypothetical protein [Polyangiaceae bacterium]